MLENIHESAGEGGSAHFRFVYEIPGQHNRRVHFTVQVHHNHQTHHWSVHHVSEEPRDAEVRPEWHHGDLVAIAGRLESFRSWPDDCASFA